MLAHMDESCFNVYVVVTQINCKVLLTSIGLDQLEYCIHHKNCIVNEMYSVVTAFILNKNGIKGGVKIFAVTYAKLG